MESDASWLAITKVFAVAMTLATIIVTAGLVYLGIKLIRLLDRLTRGIEPILRRAGETAETISRTTQAVSERAQRTAADAESRIERAAANLEAAAETVRKSAAGPLGSVSALLTGLRLGLRESAGSDPSRDPGEPAK